MKTPIFDLVLLRYRLLWARARTTRGRLTLAILVYAVFVAGGLLQAAGGFALAGLASSIGRSREVATIVFSTLGLIAGGAAFGLGLGTQRAFSEEHLRRFPLTAGQRFLAQFVLGILDPFWVTVSAGAVGLALGFYAAGVQALAPALTAAALFVVCCYVLVSAVLSMADAWMRTSPSPLVVTLLAMLLVAFLGLGVAASGRHTGAPIARQLAAIVPFLPSSLAAMLLTQADTASRLFSLVGLVAWTTAGAVLLRAVSGSTTRRTCGPSRAADLSYRLLARLAGAEDDPLVDKALRYHARCARLLLHSVSAVAFIPAMSLLMARNRGTAAGYYVGFALCFVCGLGSTSAMTLNLFGYDAAGARRYLFLPCAPEDALRAGLRASLVIGGVVSAAACAVWLAAFAPHVGTKLSLAVAFAAVGGVPTFAAVGAWVSVFAPRRASLPELLGNPLSGAGLIAQVVPLGVAFLAAFVATRSLPLATAERFWWLSLALPIGGTWLYRSSSRLVENVRDRIRFRVLPEMALGTE